MMRANGMKREPGGAQVQPFVADIPRSILERLVQYHQIALGAGEDGNENLSSGFLSEILNVDETLVRKDMASVGIVGKPRVGYSTGQIINKLEETMGLSKNTDAVLIGCGGIGSALLRYTGFRKYGLRIAAAFDSDYQKVNQRIGDYVILPMEKCRSVINTFRVKVAILAVPAGVAQETADWLVKRGVLAIWNFAPIHLKVPEGIVVRNENLALGLAELIHRLKRKNIEGGDGPLAK
jgi:redox-sensing transcriptional repressor